jgi:glutaredoxin-dependent peroxiredoxin
MALSVGSKAPAFTLIDTERKPRSLSEFVGKKTVLAFYPGAFTGVCTKEMCSFRDSLASLAKVDGQVVGISVDSPFANKAFADQNKLGFPLLSDFDLVVSKQYVGIYEAFAGIAGYKASKRSVFVLDSTGTVKYVWVTENPGVEPPYDEINKALASF